MPKPFHLHVPPVLLERARAMRHEPVSGEKKLWSCLRARQLAGLKFRRQHPIGPYIVDFCCCEAKLVVESDGDSHDIKKEYDDRRDQWLKDNDWRVTRYHDLDICKHLDAVLEDILRQAERQLHPQAYPSP